MLKLLTEKLQKGDRTAYWLSDKSKSIPEPTTATGLSALLGVGAGLAGLEQAMEYQRQQQLEELRNYQRAIYDDIPNGRERGFPWQR